MFTAVRKKYSGLQLVEICYVINCCEETTLLDFRFHLNLSYRSFVFLYSELLLYECCTNESLQRKEVCLLH